MTLPEHELTFVTTSEEAITCLHDQIFALVFLDLYLTDGPERGYRVADEIRNAAHAKIDVIVHSMNIAAGP